MTRNILLKIEYRGANFAGWQYQADHRTVQGELKECLERFLRHEVKLIGAGRTDAGVHALAQYANFRTENMMKADKIKYRLNRMLPQDIVIHACRPVPEAFSARRSATVRSYRYLICEKLSAIHRDFSWVIGHALDLELLKSLSAQIGRAIDFGNFCKVKSRKENNLCQVEYARWTRYGGFLRFDIRANRFLHNMVRLLVGTMVAVIDNRLETAQFIAMLENKKDEKAKFIAPACGLYLAGVGYERIRI